MHAPNLLHLGPRHRLVVGDDRERLQRGAREAAADDAVHGQVRGQIRSRAEGPAAGHLREMDAAVPVMRREPGQPRLDIGAFRQLGRERRGINGPARGEDHGLHDTRRAGGTLVVLAGFQGGQGFGQIGHDSSRLRRR